MHQGLGLACWRPERLQNKQAQTVLVARGAMPCSDRRSIMVVLDGCAGRTCMRTLHKPFCRARSKQYCAWLTRVSQLLLLPFSLVLVRPRALPAWGMFATYNIILPSNDFSQPNSSRTTAASTGLTELKSRVTKAKSHAPWDSVAQEVYVVSARRFDRPRSNNKYSHRLRQKHGCK